MNLPFIVLISCVALYFIFRICWMAKGMYGFAFIMNDYATRNKIEHAEIAKYCRLSSLWYILFDLIHWDFTKYVVYKEKYLEVNLFYLELAKKLLEECKEEKND